MLSSASRHRQPLMFRARSYMAFVFAPQPPIADWLAELDGTLGRAKGFFAQHPVALDLSSVDLNPAGIAQLVASLEERNIRILGIEGIEAVEPPAGLPPILRNGRGAQTLALPELESANAKSVAEEPPPRPQATSLLIQEPVRSGQSVVFLDGDVTVLGSVGSGAEIVAGGSIHVYGALRGRAIAGAGGNAGARIFCHCVEAELLAIDCYYKTAEDIDIRLRRRPAQAWLESGKVRISALN
jgi:septum site-determining protein MinC